MCDVTVAKTIVEVLDEAVKNQEVFTAYDITIKARKLSDDTIFHSGNTIFHKDVKNIVVNKFVTQQMPGYNRELCKINKLGKPEALVYYPDGKSVSDHSLVLSAPILDNAVTPDDDLDDDFDDDDFDDEEIVVSKDVYNLTAEGRVNIPKTLLDKVAPSAGGYDVLVSGTLRSIAPNKDSRVRVSLKNMGISSSKVRMTVDTSNNTINIESV